VLSGVKPFMFLNGIGLLCILFACKWSVTDMKAVVLSNKVLLFLIPLNFVALRVFSIFVFHEGFIKVYHWKNLFFGESFNLRNIECLMFSERGPKYDDDRFWLVGIGYVSGKFTISDGEKLAKKFYEYLNIKTVIKYHPLTSGSGEKVWLEKK
jgi:hypothetical protein